MWKETMKALLVYKKSTYEIYVLENKVMNLSEQDVVSLKESHDANAVSIKAVEDALNQLGIEYRKTWRAESFDQSDYLPDLVIAVGGDGTFIEASRIVHGETLILGVNSDPAKSHGHYCCSHRGNVLEALRAIQNKTAKAKLRWRLVLDIDGEEYDFPAMNDILIHHVCPAGLTHYIIESKNEVEEHFCSGIWVCTPCGQSGAISSFDGPSLFDDSCLLGFKAFGLNGTKKSEYKLSSGIGEEITFKSKMREGMIYVDGQRVQIPFPYNSELKVYTDDGIWIVCNFPV